MHLRYFERFLCAQSFVYDGERDAFYLCNEVIGHVPAGSSTTDYIERQVSIMSAMLDASGQRVPFEAFQCVCKAYADSLPI